MKKIIYIILFTLIAFSSNAQKIETAKFTVVSKLIYNYQGTKVYLLEFKETDDFAAVSKKTYRKAKIGKQIKLYFRKEYDVSNKLNEI